MEEESFPRGGKPTAEDRTSDEKQDKKSHRHQHRNKKRSLEIEADKTKANDDFLFGAPKQTTKKHKSKKSKDDNDDEATAASGSKHSLLPLGGGGVVLKKNSHKASLLGFNKDKDNSSNNAPEPFIEALGFSKLAKGTKLLGVVREVNPEFVVFSLPNLLTGYVLRSESGKNAPPLTHSVTVGQVMAVVILKTVTETIKKEGRSNNSNTTRRRIQVSMDPSAVNLLHDEGPVPKLPVRGKVQALEDNGILIDLGHGRKGFLQFDQMDENEYKIKEEDDDGSDDEEEDEEDGSGDGRIVLQVGRIADFLVKKAAKSTSDIVPLSLPSRDQLATHIVPTDSTPSIQAIAPGWLVKVKVEALARNGLCVAFFGNVFRGAVELSHLGGFWIPTTRQTDGSSDWKSLFRDDGSSPIRSFTARILAVDPATKLVRLTVLPHLMDLCPPPSSFLPSPGTVVEDATVIRLDPGVGALLALPPSMKEKDDDEDDDDNMQVDDEDEDEEQQGVRRPVLHKSLTEKEKYLEATKVRACYVHISKAMDDADNGKTPEALFAKEFAPSTTHKLRILSTSNLIEGVASGATAPSVITAHVLTYADLIPGKIYRQVPVCAHINGGAILVDFGMGIRGLISAAHLFDQAGTSEFRSKMLKAKYAIDAKVDVRVLTSDPATKRCILTAKKSLLQASNIITSYKDCNVGKTATGFITKIDDEGLSVTFFNNVFGRVTARSLALELGIDDHRENYKIGDVVQARVANIQKIRRGRHRSMADHESDDEEDSDQEATHQYFWRLNLSLRVNPGEDTDEKQLEADKASSRSVQLRAGSILPSKSIKVVKLVPGTQKKDSYIPGYAIVSVKSKYLVDEAESATMLPYVECKLPYDQLLDDYSPEDRESAASMDELAAKLLTVGKKLSGKGFLMTNPRKSTFEFASGIGKLMWISIRPKLVEAAEAQLNSDEKEESTKVILPTSDTHLYVGAKVLGYVSNVDRRHGAFVRFLDGVTGLVPKKKGGLDLDLYSTIAARIDAIDVMSRPPKISLSVGKVHKVGGSQPKAQTEECPLKPGDDISSAEVKSVDFFEAILKITDKKWRDIKATVVMHCTAAQCEKFEPEDETVIKSKYTKPQSITKYHPFHKWTVGEKLEKLRVVNTWTHHGVSHVEVTNRVVVDDEEKAQMPAPIISKEQAPPGSKVYGIVKEMSRFNKGIFFQLSPKLSGFLPALECSTDPNVLNNMAKHFPIGACLECTVIDKLEWMKVRAKASKLDTSKGEKDADPNTIYLSLLCQESSAECKVQSKPAQGDLVIGHIRHAIKPLAPPSLMLELRGGYIGRCCITELEEVDDWVNLPLGHSTDGNRTKEAAVVSGESDMDSDDENKKNEKGGRTRRSTRKRGTKKNSHVQDAKKRSHRVQDVKKRSHDVRDLSHVEDGSYPDNTYVQCRVVGSIPGRPVVDVSLRPSRIEGDLDRDEIPDSGEMVHAYVVETNKSGCFLRLTREINGRVILKELADEFVPNPADDFPPGRLVVGKIKDIKHTKQKKTIVDLDLRQSTVMDTNMKFSDVELNSKHKATVTRVEPYGVFVRLENSNVSGLVHKSECSDKYVKSTFDLYDPGDLVKVLVIKKDEEEKKIGFSMKASHFADDEDSDDESLSEGMSVDSDENEDEDDNANVVPTDKAAIHDDDLDSDDENFASKLAEKLHSKANGKEKAADESSSSSSSSDDDNDSDSSSESENDKDEDELGPAKEKPSSHGMDTDVGFDWNASSSLLSTKKTTEQDSDSDDEDMEEDDTALAPGSSHKSRKKQAQKKREEQEIFRRETALADGTADENPETAADFERLISGDPNSSELWIRYMAFHLSLADVPSARGVAERAFARIEFREEREKLNVWSALLTLELKYGSGSSLQKTIDRACQQNNPKQVYLRVCEMLEKEVNLSSPDTIGRADDMFAKMCKKFKSKKKVWIAHLQYLLKASRHKEAHDLLSRALKSLPEYKHVETMSKFAQLEFEFGSPERARTVFDGILLKNPKRLDLVFVYADKEIKHGSVEMARTLFDKIANPPGNDAPKSKLTDKQMKSLFKKWYRIEEEHGTAETQERVKEAAKAYVARTTGN